MSPVFTVMNSGSALANVNVGGTDIDAFTYKNAVTLTAAELATLLDGVTFHERIAVCFDMTGFTDAEQLKRSLFISAFYAST